MTYATFTIFCTALRATSHVVQWGGADVWKVGGKVFAIGRDGATPAYTFKTSDLAYEILRHQPGLRPAPYLASRGFKWIQQYDSPGLSTEELKEYLYQSYILVAKGLSKKKQHALGLDLERPFEQQEDIR